jgi:hypothetical protein
MSIPCDRSPGPQDPGVLCTEGTLSIGARATIVALIAGLVGATSLFLPISPFDAGLASSSGTFLLHGALPYRDFWWLYGPLASPISAAFTAVFGPSLLLIRLLGLGTCMAQATAGYFLLRGRCPEWAAATIAIAGAGAATAILGLDLSVWGLALAFALIGLAVRLDGRRPVLAGIVIGLAFATRFDVGAYALIASVLTLERRRWVLGGFGIVASVLALAIVATGSLSMALNQAVWYPLVGQRPYRAVPLPDLSGGAAMLLFIVLVVIPRGALAAGTLLLLTRRGTDRLLTTLLVFALCCQFQTVTRGDFPHQAQVALPAYLMVGAAWPGSFTLRRGTPGRLARLGGSIRFGVASVLTALVLSVAISGVSRWDLGPLPVESQQLIAAIRTLHANTTTNQPIFVGATGHRHAVLNDMIAYYLADRPSAVRDSMFNPGVTNTDQIQEAMVADLAASRTRLILADRRWTDFFEPSNDSRIPGATILDDYLRAHYVSVCDYGTIAILSTPEAATGIQCASVRADTLLDILPGIPFP